MNKLFLIIFSIVLLVNINPSMASVIRVPTDYPTIQAGIDAARDEDTVLVADGIYTGEGNRDISFRGKSIVVSSENGAETCIIDCQGSQEENHRGFIFEAQFITSSPTLNGFTIKNGYHYSGGGIYIREEKTSLTISNCIIMNNTAPRNGGGVDSRDCRLVIENSSFLDNPSGAIQMWNGTLTVKNCTFSGNRETTIGIDGVAVSIESSAFINNYNDLITSRGGGIHANDSSMEVSNSVFLKNRAYRGGAISIKSTTDSADVRITNCLIALNWADDEGGGICSESYNENYISSLSIVNSSIYGNLTYWGKNTIFLVNSKLSVINSIIWGNDNGIEYDTLPPEISYSVIKNGYEGIGNSDQDPLIIGGTPFDFHLLPDSPCIDAGSTEGAPDIDLDGRARPNGAGVDIGAFEFYWPSVTQTYISMPSRSFQAGDIAYSNCTVWNPTDYALDHHNLFVILDVFGELYMAPSFTDFDCYQMSFQSGSTNIIVSPEFSWPSGVGSASGVVWYAGLVNPEMTEIVGNIGVFDFEWSE